VTHRLDAALPPSIPALLLSSLCCAANAGDAPARPADVIDLQVVAPTIAQDIRYHGSNNFIGRPIAGYRAARCLLTRPAADALKAVQQQLLPFGYSLKVYDCYRPQRAVDDFVQWAADLDDQRMQARFYPGVDKQHLFRDGYIAARSGHSRASTVDLTSPGSGKSSLRWPPTNSEIALSTASSIRCRNSYKTAPAACCAPS